MLRNSIDRRLHQQPFPPLGLPPLAGFAFIGVFLRAIITSNLKCEVIYEMVATSPHAYLKPSRRATHGPLDQGGAVILCNLWEDQSQQTQMEPESDLNAPDVPELPPNDALSCEASFFRFPAALTSLPKTSRARSPVVTSSPP